MLWVQSRGEQLVCRWSEYRAVRLKKESSMMVVVVVVVRAQAASSLEVSPFGDLRQPPERPKPRLGP